MNTLGHYQRNDITVLVALSFILIVIGFIFIYSSSSIYALEQWNMPHYFVYKQLRGLIIGLVGFISIQCIPLDIIKRLSFLAFLAAAVLTLLTATGLGIKIHGAHRWICVAGIILQPSELLKLCSVLFAARFLSIRMQNGSLYRSYLPYLCIVGISVSLVLFQPDFGAAVVIAATGLSLFFMVHFSTKQLWYTLISGIPLVLGSIVLYPYRMKRIITFINPWADPHGAGFQIIQSLIAIGSGSMWGVGISLSKQKFFYLPMLHTDFIFSIIAEETGFIGALVVILLYVTLLYYLIKSACALTDVFSYIMVMGITMILSLQTVLNFFVTTGLVPTKGIGLPFISYGSSALTVHICSIGLVVSSIRNSRKSIASSYLYTYASE